MDRQESSSSALTSLGFGVLAFNSVLAIYTSWGDAGSVAFVLLADAAVLLLFLCLRDFEQGGKGRHDAKTTKAVVWALTTTLLTAMFASGVAPTIMPLMAVGVLVFLCLRDVDHVGAHRTNLDAQYCALAKVGFAVLTCNAALDANDDTSRERDLGSAVLVLVSYAVLVILTCLFVRSVAPAHAGDGEHGQAG